MTSIYSVISIETRLATDFSGYKTITIHEKAMLYVLNHYFCFFAYLKVVSATFLLVCFVCLKEHFRSKQKRLLFHFESSFRS